MGKSIFLSESWFRRLCWSFYARRSNRTWCCPVDLVVVIVVMDVVVVVDKAPRKKDVFRSVWWAQASLRSAGERAGVMAQQWSGSHPWPGSLRLPQDWRPWGGSNSERSFWKKRNVRRRSSPRVWLPPKNKQIFNAKVNNKLCRDRSKKDKSKKWERMKKSNVNKERKKERKEKIFIRNMDKSNKCHICMF